MQSYVQEDSMLVEKIVYEVKSQGIFDQFRKECIADVDTKPAYQNLRQRVEGSVSGFLGKQKWSPDMNKNHVREMLRKNIYESGFLETGVERIVDQVVNPKINSIFLPKVTELVYKFFGIQKPGEKKEPKPPAQSENLLPTDLEAVSPESEKHSEQGNDEQNIDDSKIDEDESPPFEPLEEQGTYVVPEETSVDSHMSGFSGLISHDSNGHELSKPVPIETSNQDSVTSKQSSDRLSIVTSDDNETKMDVDEKSKRDDKEKKQESKSKDDKSRRSRHDSRSDRKDKDRKDRKERHSSNHDKSKERKDSKDKSKSHSSSHRHSSSSHRSHKDSSSSSKDRDKSKLKTSSSSNNNKDKDKLKDEKSKESSKRHHSDSKSSSSSSKHKKSDHHSKTSSRSKDKKDSKSKDKNKDCESETKKRSYRRSTDRDSNDGHSSLKSSSSSFESFSSNAQASQQDKKESSNTTNSGDSGNSDGVEKVSAMALDQELSISVGTIKLFKPKFASNIHEAKRLMKIRKKLAQIENEQNIQIKVPKKEPPAQVRPSDSPPLPSVNVSAATWDALEAKLNESIANENYYKDSYYDTPDTPEKKEKPQDVIVKPQNDECYYFEKVHCSKTERYVKFISDLVEQLERNIVNKEESKSRKRKITEVNSDFKNNKKFNIEVHENFPLPLSPAESDNSLDKKSDISEASDKKIESDAISKAKRIIRAPASKKRYSSEDLYKPRLCFSSSRRHRMTRNAGID